MNCEAILGKEAPREVVHSQQGVRPLHDLEAFLYKIPLQLRRHPHFQSSPIVLVLCIL